VSQPTSDTAGRSVWQLATSPAVVRRSLGFALGVGSVLVAINHGDAIWSGEVEAKRWLQIGLTTMVPYCVSTASSVMAARQAQVQPEIGSEVD
jgi:hypothetical protein